MKAWTTLDGTRPLVIGHRGACGYLPEHTLASYARAIELGADFVEPDLVATLDGHLIARHEPLLDETTDVASHAEFAARKTTRLLDGVSATGFFACDFTLAEIKQLRARQSRPNRSQEFDGLYEIPTLREIIELVQNASANVGIYPETKHPSFHAALGLSLEDPLLEILTEFGWDARSAPVYIQSFETGNLQYLRRRTDLKLVQLIDAWGVDEATGALTWSPPTDKPYNHAITGDRRGFQELVTLEGLRFVATYADAIGPWKSYIARPGITTSLISDAHGAGLAVHAFTFREDANAEYEQLFALGLDGVFSDFPDAAVLARERMSRS